MSEKKTYEIRIGNVLDDKWANCFDPFTITLGQEETVLVGEVHDQAELFGVLLKIRDLGLRLVAINPVNPG
jgi:uncharacterized protein with GYD domain